jgi:hypothetical protein
MSKAVALILVFLAMISSMAVMAPESDSDAPLEVVMTDGIRWFRTAEPVDAAPSGHHPGTMYLSKDPDDPLMKAYLYGEATRDDLVEKGRGVEAPCYVFCHEGYLDRVPGNPEFVEMDSPPTVYLYMAEGTCRFVPSIQTSGRVLISGNGGAITSFSDVLDVTAWRDGTYEMLLRDCPYHCVRFTLVSGDARVLPHESGTVAHEMCTISRWVRGTCDVEPGSYSFSCYAFPEGSAEDVRFRTEVAEEFMTDVPNWAKSTRTTPTVVEKTTRMAFYDLKSSDAMVVSYRQSGFAHQIHPSECEVIRPNLPEHLYLFAPANEHVSFALTYDMSCGSMMLSLPDGKRLIASDSRYDMVFSESTTLDFTIEYARNGFKDLPLSMTVSMSAEGFADPDGLAMPAAAMCILAFVAAASALAVVRLRERRAGADRTVR